ncbi:MAG TPA: lytic transglycosylase domain-containing protein [Solirubrobacterales bacterium]|nr:lytic transglycosylase domain-containing protein [Solirubrobacterales bacterium]
MSPKRSRRKRTVRRRRLLTGVGVVAAGVLAGLALGVFGKVDDAIQELTLPLRHEDIIRQEAAQWDVEPALVAGMIYAESHFRDQTSHADARGLMQITPDTARFIARRSRGTEFVLEDLSDPDVNIAYGTFYMRYLLDALDQNEVAALAAYNAGLGNVEEWGGTNLELDDIRFGETRSYVEQVLEKRGEYRETYPRELGYR